MSVRSASAAARILTRQAVSACLAATAVAALTLAMTGSAHAHTAGPASGPAPAVAPAPARNPGIRAVLNAVSCKGRDFCMAIGTSRRAGHPEIALAEEWNGKKWRTVPDPLPGLLASITCGSPSLCMAARSQAASPGTDMIEWDGRNWRVMKNQPADPGDVACVSSSLCMTIHGTMIAGWNGAAWQDMPNSDACSIGPPPCGWNGFACGNGGSVTGVSCIGSFFTCPDEQCTGGILTEGAVFTLTGGWNVGGGGLPFLPSGGDLGCAGRSFCMITSGPRAEVTQDAMSGNWQDVTPNLAAVCHGAANCTLNGAAISCGYPGHCMALPRFAVVTMAWNGTTWTAPPLAPIRGLHPQLVSISCGSASNCIAVGNYKRTRWRFRLTIAEHWNGTAWQITPTPNT